MSEADEAEGDDAGAGTERPKFVYPTRRCGAEAEQADEEPLVVLCSVPAADAVGFCDRLEAEGIPCGARESEATASAPVGDGLTAVTLFADVWVRAEDLEIAREILARPPEEPEEEESPTEREARFVGNWICPRCERPGLELLPLSRGMWHLRMGCLGMLAVPMLMGFVSWLVPRWKGTNEFPNWAWMIWLVVGLCVAWACVLPERGRACKGCGWRSGGSDK